MELKKLFGKKLKEIRMSRGLTQEQLAELCDMQTTSIGMIEIGLRAVSFATIEVFAEKLGVDFVDLFDFNSDIDIEKSEDKLLVELNREVGKFDKTLLKHIVDYSKTMNKLFKNRRKYD